MIPVKRHIVERAHIASMEEYQDLSRQSLDRSEDFWRRQAELLTWFLPPRNVLDVDLEEVDFSWHAGGRLNACVNCVDRHLGPRGDQTAIIWAADEPGEGWVGDVLNVSGHRRGTAEIESSMMAHEAVAEAAVVGFPHELKGTGLFAFVQLNPEFGGTDLEELGDLSTPADPGVVDELIAASRRRSRSREPSR